MTTRIGLALLVVASFWACGSDSVTTPEPPALERGLHEVGKMTQPRYQHVATLLQNGKVLIAGGYAEPPTKVEDPSPGGTVIYRPAGVLITAEIFDPEIGTLVANGKHDRQSVRRQRNIASRRSRPYHAQVWSYSY